MAWSGLVTSPKTSLKAVPAAIAPLIVTLAYEVLETAQARLGLVLLQVLPAPTAISDGNTTPIKLPEVRALVTVKSRVYSATALTEVVLTLADGEVMAPV